MTASLVALESTRGARVRLRRRLATGGVLLVSTVKKQHRHRRLLVETAILVDIVKKALECV